MPPLSGFSLPPVLTLAFTSLSAFSLSTSQGFPFFPMPKGYINKTTDGLCFFFFLISPWEGYHDYYTWHPTHLAEAKSVITPVSEKQSEIWLQKGDRWEQEAKLARRLKVQRSWRKVTSFLLGWRSEMFSGLLAAPSLPEARYTKTVLGFWSWTWILNIFRVTSAEGKRQNRKHWLWSRA